MVALKRISVRFGVLGLDMLKAVEGWTDLGYGDFSLGYLRDKSRREVDFVVVRDGKPAAAALFLV